MKRSAISLMLITGVATAAMLAGATPAPAHAVETSAVVTDATVETEANLRAAPYTTSAILSLMPAGTRIRVVCWATGEPTYGLDRYGSMWLYTTRDGWVHSYLVSPVDVDRCGADQVPAPPAGTEGSGPSSPAYTNCAEARAAHDTPVYRHNPRFGPHLDRDNDGIGCEWG